MRISKQMVTGIAKLARLKLNDSETEKYSEQLSSILEHMAQLKELDVSNVEPMFYGCPEANKLREDVIEKFDSSIILKNSINVKDDFFSVPSIISDGE